MLTENLSRRKMSELRDAAPMQIGAIKVPNVKSKIVQSVLEIFLKYLDSFRSSVHAKSLRL